MPLPRHVIGEDFTSFVTKAKQKQTNSGISALHRNIYVTIADDGWHKPLQQNCNELSNGVIDCLWMQLFISMKNVLFLIFKSDTVLL